MGYSLERADLGPVLGSKKQEEEVLLGTTILAVEFKDGVVLGADTRTSMGTYISNRVSRKITRISDKIFCCRSGSAADTQAIAEYLEFKVGELSLRYGTEPTVKETATMAKKIIYDNGSLAAGLIIAGVDREGPAVYAVPLGGSLIRQGCAMGGSGSIYIAGLCDKTYKEGMTKEEAVGFVKSAIAHAIYRDNSSGGCTRLLVVTSSGTEEIFVPGDEVSI